MLKEKYAGLLELGSKLEIKDGYVNEEDNRLRIGGTAAFQMQKDQLWDKIKTYENWENEVEADIKVECEDCYGHYMVQPGDSLSKIAKMHLGSAGKYMEIFNLNTDILSNPNLIKVGQNLKLPFKG